MSEGAPRHTSVVSVSARDPEGATVTYSLASGDSDGHFSIGESTGVIRVMQALDREEVRLYSLVRFYEDSTLTKTGKSSWLFFRLCEQRMKKGRPAQLLST